MSLIQVREALTDLSHSASAIAQSSVTALLVPVSDLVALAPRPLLAQLLQDAATISALLAQPSQRTLAQRALIVEKIKDTAALGTLPGLQRSQVAASSQFMRVPSGSCIFYRVIELLFSSGTHVEMSFIPGRCKRERVLGLIRQVQH
jgi:hypothetical protein